MPRSRHPAVLGACFMCRKSSVTCTWRDLCIFHHNSLVLVWSEFHMGLSEQHGGFTLHLSTQQVCCWIWQLVRIETKKNSPGSGTAKQGVTFPQQGCQQQLTCIIWLTLIQQKHSVTFTQSTFLIDWKICAYFSTAIFFFFLLPCDFLSFSKTFLMYHQAIISLPLTLASTLV